MQHWKLQRARYVQFQRITDEMWNLHAYEEIYQINKPQNSKMCFLFLGLFQSFILYFTQEFEAFIYHTYTWFHATTFIDPLRKLRITANVQMINKLSSFNVHCSRKSEAHFPASIALWICFVKYNFVHSNHPRFNLFSQFIAKYRNLFHKHFHCWTIRCVL